MPKLPPRGIVDIEVMTQSDYVLTIKRSDGEELSIHLTKDELRNLAKYLQALLEVNE